MRCTRAAGVVCLLFFTAVGCEALEENDSVEELEEEGGTLLGTGEPEEMQFTQIADGSYGLKIPRDLGFHPGREGELWIVNQADDSVTIIFDATGEAKHHEHRIDGYAMHFMDEVSSIAFGDPTYRDDYTFGTCQESENTYNGRAAPNYFMGPTLWTADLDVFAVANPIGLGSHLDMLHHSPNCMGIAHETENAYWVFDGYHGQIVRYDFQEDHDAGYDDHSDGIIRFLDEPKVERVEGVPSHMILDKATGWLYVADTGNHRVLRIDTATGTFKRKLRVVEPETTVEEWTETAWNELIPASSGLLQKPSGIALHDGVLYVGDNATGEILAFDLEGKLIARLQTPVQQGGLAGLEVGPDERLYFVDLWEDRIFRLEPAP